MARKKKSSKKKVSFESKYPDAPKPAEAESLLSKCAQLEHDLNAQNQANERLKKDLIQANVELEDVKRCAEDKIKSLLKMLHKAQESLLISTTQPTAAAPDTAAIKDIEVEVNEENLALQEQEKQQQQVAKIPAMPASVLLKKLLDTQEELYSYKQQLADTTDEHGQKILYGARARVEQDLPYRLGRVTLQHYHTAKDLLKIPNLLLKEYQDFMAENQDQSKLPPLESYIDYEEAEKVKRHLSYKIGVPLAQTLTSPKNAVKLPYEVSKQLYLFKLKK